jgi:PKD repeat protein
VYYRAATAGDVGGTVAVTFSGATKNSVTLADYHGADPNSIEAFAKAVDSSTTTHTTPTATVSVDGSLAVSYWTDKSSTTTGWTLPGSVTPRASFFDTGSGYVTSELADSGSTVPSGSYGSKTATVTGGPSGKGAEWTIILAPAGSTNAPPVADFTSNCTNLNCTFDASGSHDPDGSIASYAWDFGDGNTGTGASPSHSYATGGTYHVHLTVTDNGGATGSITKDVTPSLPTQNIGFVGANTYDNSGASGSVTIPAATSSGDTLLLFESHNSTSVTATAPAGWTQVGTTTSASNLRSAVYEKTATGADAGSSATVTFSASVKAQLTVADYKNVSTTPIEAAQSNTSGAGTSHTTPAISGLTAGTWVLSFWTDKSTTTTAWTPPAGVTKRSDVYGTAGGAVSALLADSGTGVSGSYPAQTATTNVSSGSSVQWTVALAPAS